LWRLYIDAALYNREVPLSNHEEGNRIARMRCRWYFSLSIVLLLAACSRPAVGTSPEEIEPEFPPVIAIEPVADLETSITSLTNAGDGSGRMFITTRTGSIYIVKNGRLLSRPFIDLTNLVDSASIEQGLLGLAFDPDYAETGEFYLNFTNTETEDDTIVARYRVSADPDVADPASREDLLFVEQPANNHNAGHMLFGSDGYLYIALGDGGPGNDLKKRAQNPQELLGKILRLDVRGQTTYAIPPDNPFAGTEGYRPEIWALGLRNPWRFAFDPLTGEFYLGDVGQETWEELNFVQDPGAGGLNFGWNITEGPVCFSPPEGCNRTGLVEPVYTYRHGPDGCSITGGYVYRGAAHPEWAGTYFFSDFCTGLIRGAQRSTGGAWTIAPILDTDLAVVSFGLDEDGELYVLDLMGAVYRIVPGDEALGDE
jgi:glucose/arabinose dehydrogenase